MEEQGEMLNNAIEQNTQLYLQNAELMEANREYRRESVRPEATKTKIINMTHPERYCGRSKELDNFLDMLRSNFQSHVHLFPHGDPEKVKYPASLPSRWNSYPDPAQRQTQMTDPVEWLRDLQRDSNPCLEDFEAFPDEIQKMYGDEDRKINTAMKCMTNILQGANEPVRVYANRIKANWRAVGWLSKDTRTFTKSLGADYDQDLSPRSSHRPQRTEDSTVWKSFSTTSPIQKSSRTAKSLNCSSHNNSKGSQESDHLNKAARNATSDHPYPSRPKHRSPKSQSRTRMINALQGLGSRQSSTKLGCRKENAYAGDYRNIKYFGARIIHPPTSPKTLLPQETENKSNASAPSIVNNQKTSLPLSVPRLAGEDGGTRAWIAVIGYEGADGNIRGNSTASDFTMAEGCHRQPERSHVKSIFGWNGKIGFIAHCPRSPDTRSTRSIAANTSTHRLRSYKHLYISTTSQ
jgi:hypothetical protein